MLIIKRLLAAGIAVALLSACSPAAPIEVKPGDSPAATATDAPPGGQEGESTEAQPTEDKVANFHEKYVYEDGGEVEVIKIKHGKVTRYDAEIDKIKAGAPYTILTIRVRNKSKKKLSVYNSSTLTYGPDGDEAKQPFLASVEKANQDISGKILPGRSKLAVETFLIPTKYQSGSDSPVLEFSFDFEREPAIFSGSLK